MQNNTLQKCMIARPDPLGVDPHHSAISSHYKSAKKNLTIEFLSSKTFKVKVNSTFKT